MLCWEGYQDRRKPYYSTLTDNYTILVTFVALFYLKCSTM